MTKRIYYITAIIMALIGVPILNYFAYSNEIGAITITDKSWTDFCNATSWDNPTDVICESYLTFTANEDTFWYPVNYDPYGRSTPFGFDPAIKDWKLERTWGKGWRQIPLTKSCTGTWCGLSNSKDKRLFSVAWREGREYNVRIRAIKEKPKDNIFWNFGPIDPYWFGININKIQKCSIVQSKKTVNDIGICYTNHTYINNVTKVNEEIFIPFDCVVGDHIEFINNTVCETTGFTIDNEKLNCENSGSKLYRDGFYIIEKIQHQSNQDIPQCLSGEGCIIHDVRDLDKPKEMGISSSKSIVRCKIEKV